MNLTEDDINQIEEFVREEGLQHATKALQKKLDCQCEILLEESQLIDYFGEIYASDPSNFRFVIGDKKLIRLVRDHLIKNENEKGAKYMRRFRKKPDRKSKVDRTPFNEFHVADNIVDADDENVALSTELSASLLQKLKTSMKSFGVDESIIQSMTHNSVAVKILDGNVAAEIFCALCQNDTTKKRKLKGKKVFYKNGENSKYWVLSNFKEHLKTVHKMTCNQSVQDTDAFDIENNDPSGDDSNGDSTMSTVMKKNKYSNHPLALASTSQENMIDKMALSHNFTYELIDVEVVPPTSPQNSSTQYSDGQNDLMFDQITAQLRKMLAAALSNSDQTEEMVFALTESELQSSKVASIAPNGACIFGAIAHQLSGRKINGDHHVEATKQIRKDVVDYISGHYSSFQKELRERVYAEINPKSIEDIDKECKTFLYQHLPLDNYWGGAETLKAVREIFKVNVLVLNERGTCHFFNYFNEEYKRTLILAYRLRDKLAVQIDIDSYDHYDSVYDIPSDGILQIIELFNKREQRMNADFDHTL